MTLSHWVRQMFVQFIIQTEYLKCYDKLFCQNHFTYLFEKWRDRWTIAFNWFDNQVDYINDGVFFNLLCKQKLINLI